MTRAALEPAARTPAPKSGDGGFLRTLPLPSGTFFEAWTKDPDRFGGLLRDPFASGALRAAAAGTPAAPAPHREEAAAVVAETTRAWGGDAQALAAAARLRRPDALAVVTGQQPGLFGGPLYSLVKAMSAVVAAERLEEHTGRPTVAVFWIEGDDHDFEEIRNAWVLDPTGAPRRFRYEPLDERPGIPACRRILDETIFRVVEQLGETLPRADFAEEALAALSAAYAPGRALSEAFGRLMLELTRETGLVVMDPTSPALRRIALPVYQTALASEVEGRRRVAARTEEIEAAGFSAQAAPAGYGVFRTGPEGLRTRIEAADARGAPRSGNGGDLSAAVLLRPLVQDFLLPTAVYVGGASEIAYHAQIGGLYDLHGLRRPLVIPRHQVSLLGPGHLRVLDRDGIGFDELSAGDEAALNRRARDPASAAALEEARGALESGLDAVEGAVGALDGSLSAAARRARGKMLAILGDLEAKSVRAAKRRDEERRRRFLRARDALFPGGAPQERRLGPLVFTSRYGPRFAGWLRDALAHPGADRRARNLLLTPSAGAPAAARSGGG